MCGRFALGLPRPQIIRVVHDEHPELNLNLDQWIDEEAFQPRFNIAPRSRSPVIRRRNRFDDRADTSEDAQGSEQQASTEAQDKKTTVMHTMKWGLIPHWSKHEDTNLNTINAKGENLTEGGGMWGSIKGRKRCVVVCQGYYEWQKKGKERIPHLTRHKDGKLMLLAGLYDSVILEGEKEPLYTFTVVTTDANKQLSWLHDRMPVVLSTPSQISTWLDTSEQKWTPKVAQVIRPYIAPSKEHDLECYPVPKEVGKVGTESPTFIEPISKRKDGIEAMFAKQSTKSGKEMEKKEDAGSSAKLAPKDGTTKRKRRSPARSSKDERESSVELLSPDSPSRNKKARIESHRSMEESANTDEPNLSSQATPNSSPKSRKRATKPSKSTNSPERASPNTAKITKFFKKG